MKFLPFTVNANAGPPSSVLSGAIESRMGIRSVSAAKTRMRDLVMFAPFRVSRIGNPVRWRTARMSPTLAFGAACFRIAHAPATCGAAIDVPAKSANAFPGTEE